MEIFQENPANNANQSFCSITLTDNICFLVYFVIGFMWLEGAWKERLQSAPTLPCNFFF